jgi:tetratricopeptide (TPR) repeat protein
MLLEAGKAKDALEHILPYLATHPDDFGALTTAAQVYLSLDEGDETIRLASQAIAIDPSSDYPMRLIAYGHMCFQRLGPARDAADAAVRLAPDSWRAHFTRAWVDVSGERLSRQGYFSSERAVLLAPQESSVHVVRAQTLDRDDDRDGAELEYREALRIDPQDRMARMGLGITKLREGDHGAASDAFIDILAADASSRAALHNLRVAAGLILRRLTSILFGTTAIGFFVAFGISYSHLAGVDAKGPIVFSIIAGIAVAALVVSILIIRHDLGRRFGQFVRSIPVIDRLLTAWSLLLAVVVLATIAAIPLSPAMAAWVYFGSFWVLCSAKTLEGARRKRIIAELHGLRVAGRSRAKR